MGTKDTLIEKSMPSEKKRPWYKNPSVSVGVFAASGTAVYFSQGEDPSSSRNTVAE